MANDRATRWASLDASDPDAFLRFEARSLASVSEDVAARAERYLVTGWQESVLDEIRAAEAVAYDVYLARLDAKYREDSDKPVPRDGSYARALALKVGSEWGERGGMRPFELVSDDAALIRLGHLYASARDAWVPKSHLEDLVPHWLEALIEEASELELGVYRGATTTSLPLERLHRVVRVSGERPECLLDVLLRGSEEGFLFIHSVVESWTGGTDVLLEHAPAVDRRLAESSARELERLLTALRRIGYDRRLSADRIVQFACDPRKSVRLAALALLHGHADEAMTDQLWRIAESAPAANRLHAWETLVALGDPEVPRRARQALSVESATRVRRVLEDVAESEWDAPVVPPRRQVEPPGTLRPDERAAVLRYAEEVEARRLELLDRPAAWRRETPAPDIDTALASIEDPERWSTPATSCLGQHDWTRDTLYRAVAAAEWRLVSLLRFVHHALHHGRSGDHIPIGMGPFVDSARYHTGIPRDLREVADALTWLGYAEDQFAELHLRGWTWGYHWDPEVNWPFFLEQIERVRDLLTGVDDAARDASVIPRILLHLRAMPSIPEQLLPSLWSLALGGARQFRQEAQDTVMGTPGAFERVVESLDDGRQAVRGTAAEWLGRLGDSRAIRHVELRLRRERTDTVRAVLCSALERLGGSLEPYVGRDALSAEAAKGLDRVPASVTPLLSLPLPDVRWADSGDAVDDLVIRWWLVKATKLKRVEPDALQRRHAALLRPSDRAALADAIVRGWIDFDLHGAPSARFQAARRRAERQPVDPDSLQAQFDEAIQRQLTENRGSEFSAIAWKGCLSLAAACGAANVAEPIGRFLRDWYGYRAAQCKALLGVLAWSDEPEATQLLLQVATRFRTAGIRKEADRLVHDCAVRHGWSYDELADRTLPDAGLERDGTCIVSYESAQATSPVPEVSRVLTLRLLSDLSVQVEDADDGGRVLSGLPDARVCDDAASVDKARKALSRIRRSVKAFVQQQRARLYEAMCGAREWESSDWRTYLLGHPIAKHLCKRVVWATVDPPSTLFRIADDGSPVDINGRPASVEGSRVRIAHASTCSADDAEAWRTHLEDAGFKALLDQFPREMHDLPGEWRDALEFDVLHARPITSFQLRSVANRRGYVRGEAGDGGWIFDYVKHYPSLRVVARLHFDGCPLPIAKGETSLFSLSVEELVDTEAPLAPAPAPIALGKLPRPLVGELQVDVAAFLAASAEV